MPKELSEEMREYLRENAKKGGQATSDRKTKAVRSNAKQGGWPKGRPRKIKR